MDASKSCRFRRCSPRSDAARLPIFLAFSRRRRARLVAADCSQHLLHVAGKNRPAELMTEFDEDVHQLPAANPETLASQADERQRLTLAFGVVTPALQRGARAKGIGRVFLQGDRGDYRNSDWHSYVH